MVLGPRQVLRLAEQGYQALEQAIGLVPRAAALLEQAEAIMARAAILVGDVEATNRRAADVVVHTESTVGAADALLAQATEMMRRLQPLLDRAEPTADALLPILDRLAKTTSPDEVSAMITLVDQLPTLVDKLQQDILPVLDTLGTVAPDLRDLLDVSRELNEMLGALPGLGRIKRRIEEKQEAEDSAEAPAQYRANEVPPPAPDRGQS